MDEIIGRRTLGVMIPFPLAGKADACMVGYTAAINGLRFAGTRSTLAETDGLSFSTEW